MKRTTDRLVGVMTIQLFNRTILREQCRLASLLYPQTQ